MHDVKNDTQVHFFQTIQKMNQMVAVLFLDQMKTHFKNLWFLASGIKAPLYP